MILGKHGGINDDQIKLRLVGFHLVHNHKGILGNGLVNGGGDKGVLVIVLHVAEGSFTGGLAQVNTDHLAGAAAGSVDGESAGVGKHIQHGFARGQGFHAGAVLALVEEEAGFLPVDGVRFKDQPVFLEENGTVQFGTGEGKPIV